MCLKFGQAKNSGQGIVGTYHAPLSPDVTVCPPSLMSPVPFSLSASGFSPVYELG